MQNVGNTHTIKFKAKLMFYLMVRKYFILLNLSKKKYIMTITLIFTNLFIFSFFG